MYFSASFCNTTNPLAAKGLKYARTPIPTSPFTVLIQGTVVVDAADLNCAISALNSTCNMNTVCLMLYGVATYLAAEDGGHLIVRYQCSPQRQCTQM